MKIITEYTLWLIIPCLFIGIAYALFLYFKNNNVEFEKKSLIVMAILRGVAISLIAFLLLAPMTSLTTKKSDKPIILFAVDNSESITAGTDSSFYTTDFVTQLNRLVGAFDDRYEIDIVYTGDETRYEKENHLQIAPTYRDKSTDLSSVFDDVEKLYTHRNVGAMVMLSDGIYNTGNSPYYKAESADFPVFTVGLGNPELQTDLFISDLNYNRQVYRGNSFPVEVKVAAHKLNGEKTVLKVFEKEKEIFTQNINITSSQYFETIRLNIEAKENGLHHYRVELTELDGEISLKNNSRSFYIEVIDTKEKIAIIYYAPHPDIAAMRHALEPIDKYDIEIFGIQNFRNRPEEYSLLILHQLPSVKNQAQQLIASALQNKISMLFILGSAGDLTQFNKLNLGLSITQNRGLFNDAAPQFNTNFTTFTFSEESRNRLQNFTPLQTFFGEYQTAVSANIFLYQKISGVNTQYPLILFNDVNGTKIGMITGTGLWQWKFYNYIYANNFDVFDEVINKTTQYLSVKNDKSFFRVHTEQLFNENENLSFSAELYNEAYELINDQDVTMTITNEEGIKYDYRFSKQFNSYYLNIGKLPIGNYSWQAAASIGNKNYTKSGRFSVQEVMIETSNLIANHTLLHSISQATNGKFYTPENMADIEKEIKNNDNIKPVVSYQKNYKLLLDSPIYFILIILLLGIEWFLRKWGGGY